MKIKATLISSLGKREELIFKSLREMAEFVEKRPGQYVDVSCKTIKSVADIRQGKYTRGW